MPSEPPFTSQDWMKRYVSIESGHLRAEIDRSEAVCQTEVTFLTVGTPESADGTVDLRYVISASEDIGRALKRKQAPHLVVVKSTVTPGTVRGPVKVALEESSGLVAGRDFGLCTNPEFSSKDRQFGIRYGPIVW